MRYLPTRSSLLHPDSPSRRRDLTELSTVYLLVLAVLWTPRPWQWALWFLACVSICTVTILSYDGLRPMGLCTVNLRRSLWAVPLAFLMSFAAIALALRLHTLHIPGTTSAFLRHYAGYAVWAGIQQLVLQCFFLTRSLRLLPNATAAAALCAALFAVAHLPNPFLTVVTLIFGLASCLFFLHYHNLWPLVLAHAILGISIGITVPGALDHNMRVGLGYLTYIDRSAHQTATASTKPQGPN